MQRWPETKRADQPLPLLGGMAEHGARFAPACAQEAFRAEDASTAVRDRAAKAHLEGPQAPRHQYEAERYEREHHAVDRPALLHDPAVQDGETGEAHQPDERRRGHLPCVVAGVEPGWV